MIQLMTVDQLVTIAAGAGIKLEKATPDTENLYVYATRDKHENVYVGTSLNRKRSVNEKHIGSLPYTDRINVGFTALVQENDAERHSFRYDSASFDPNVMLDHMTEYRWSTTPIDNLRARLEGRTDAPAELSVAEVEQVLIRIHVITGRLIGNSKSASQWEGGAWSIPNVVAVIAADIARETGVGLPKNANVDDEGVTTEEAPATEE